MDLLHRAVRKLSKMIFVKLLEQCLAQSVLIKSLLLFLPQHYTIGPFSWNRLSPLSTIFKIFFFTFILWLRVPLAHCHLSPGICVSSLRNGNVYWVEQEAWTLTGA